jgi:hypothetical protein
MQIDKRASFGISPLIALALFFGQVAPGQAQSLDGVFSGIDFSVNGFGTAGAVMTNSNSGQFVRGAEVSGANKSASESVDSNIAVQGTARFNSWLSATVQALQQADRMTRPIAWAYLKIEPVSNLSIKVGKVEMPLFMISDSRDIGYANTWVRPPNEVYGLSNSEELKGGEVTYTLPIRSANLSLTVYGGNSQLYTTAFANASWHAWDVHGGEVRLETKWVTLRGGLMTEIVELPATSEPTHPKYVFSGYGALIDHNNFIAQAEWVSRKSAPYPTITNSEGWYVMGGYRFGTLAPYASFAATVKTKPYFPYGIFSGDQNTKAIGVRWDAFKSADFKFQLERIDPKGTQGISLVDEAPGFGNNEVTAVTVLIDFVF